MKKPFPFLAVIRRSWGRVLALSLGLGAAPLALRAQVDTYQFAPSTAAYAPLPAAPAATDVPAILDDDELSAPLPLGFTFRFDGTNYTQVIASSNGFLTFNPAAPGTSTTDQYANELEAAVPDLRPLLAPFWDDLDGSDPASRASYRTAGTAPNRVFTFEWLNWQTLNNGGPAFSLQVRLYETTNVVQFAYRQEPGGLSFPADASIGLVGVGTGSGSFLSLGSSGPTPPVSSAVATDTLGAAPATGQVYAFTPAPPSACPVPRNLTATPNGAAGATLTWSTGGGNGTFTVLYGPAGFVPPAGTAVSGLTNPTATLTGLAPGNYQFYVTQVCGGAAGSSPLSNPGSFSVACPTPTSLAVGNLTNTTATLTWATPTAAGSTFSVLYGPSGFDPALPSGGSNQYTTVSGVTGTSYQLTNLAPNAPYTAYVVQNCQGNANSANPAGPVNFSTLFTAPANDEPCGATALVSGANAASNVGATTTAQGSIQLPACTSAQLPKDVWFTFVPRGSTVNLAFTGAAAGMARLYAAPSCAAGPFTQVGCQAASAANTGFAGPVSFSGLTAGTRYYLAVSGFGSNDTQGSFTVQAGSGQLPARAPAADADALRVYPNPSGTGYLLVQWADAGAAAPAAQAELLNSLGQLVRRAALPAALTEHRLDVRGLAAGLYTLRVQAGGHVLARKVTLE